MRFDTYAGFVTWFTSKYNQIVLENGVRECGPFLRPTVKPDLPPWKVEWFVIFPDGKYLRASENYFAEPKRIGGGGYRAAFSFHYGDLPPNVDSRGCPKWDDHDQKDLRIDVDPQKGPHIHFGGEDHILQPRVTGLNIEAQDMFGFVDSILVHRSTRGALNEVFGFHVEASE